MWFDVGNGRYTTEELAKDVLPRLWFDVGNGRYTTDIAKQIGAFELWFDVEIELFKNYFFFLFYTTLGVQILAKKIETDNIDINISNQPNGVYLLQITINGKSTTWKIVKK